MQTYKLAEKLLFALTVIVFLVFSLTPVFQNARAASITNLSMTQSRQQISAFSDNTVTATIPSALNVGNYVYVVFNDFGYDTAAVSSVNFSSSGTAVFDNANFRVTFGDFDGDTLNDDIGLISAEVTSAGAAGEVVTIDFTMTNPDVIDVYTLDIVHTDGSNVGLSATSAVTIDEANLTTPIVADDTVDVTGFIEDLITFDIDTTSDTLPTTRTDCDASTGLNPCDGHSNPVAGGQFDGVGYTVSLGNLITTDYNASGDTVVHEDGASGQINTIAFDLTANVSGGANVSVESLYGALDNSGNQIPSPSVGSSFDLAFISGYGLQYRDSTANTGGVAVLGGFNSSGSQFGGVDTNQNTMFNTFSSAIDEGRILFNIGARPDVTNPVGTYTDELTFTATANF